MRAIRDAVEQVFGATLPPTATLNDELEIITRTIHVIATRPSPVSAADADTKTHTYFVHHIDTRNEEGENIVGRGYRPPVVASIARSAQIRNVE
jgi:hypothetical protein